LASSYFKKIELDCECEPDSPLYDSILIFESILAVISLANLDPIPEPIFIPTSIDIEYEPPILDTRLPLMDHECELQFFDLEPTFEAKLTFQPKLDLTHIPESVLVSELFILEPKSTIPPSHILLLDQGVNYYDSKMIFKDWSYNWNDFNVRILHDPIQFGDNKNVNRKEIIKSGFLETPHYLDWAVTLDPIRPHWNHHFEVTFFFPFFFFMHICFHSYIKDNA